MSTSTALQIAQHYFELSNQSDFTGIEALMGDATTYSSQTTGIYLGVKSIIAMQKAFHSKFSALHWNVRSVTELKPGVILVDYDFIASLLNAEEIVSFGNEYVIVYNSKIQHIEITNKP